MKLILFIFFFLLSITCLSQVVSLKNDKVTIRDYDGKYITSSYYWNLHSVDGGKDIIVLWYDNNKIEVRDYRLKYISSRYFSDLENVKASENNVILYYKNGKIETRDRDLDFLDSFYN